MHLFDTTWMLLVSYYHYYTIIIHVMVISWLYARDNTSSQGGGQASIKGASSPLPPLNETLYKCIGMHIL
jgi:hypothetical protein